MFENLNNTDSNRKYYIFGAHLLKGAEYDVNSGWDIPYVDTPIDLDLPINLVGYNKTKYCKNRSESYLHFFQDDYIFDGRMGIWYTLLFSKFFKKGFNFNKLDGYRAIITPDFSMYYDMPIIMQMWNLFRSRVIGYHLSKLGYSVVVNLRWTDKNSYKYCFSGLRQNDIVAVSTLGCLRSKIDNEFFMLGLEELVCNFKPKTIILYGTLNEQIKNLLKKYNQDYLFFQSEISSVHNGDCNGNENE